MNTHTTFARRHRWKNFRDSALLLLGMGGLLSLTGYALLGVEGLIAGAVFLAITRIFSPRMTPALARRLFQARPLEYRDAPWLYELVHELARRARLEVPPLLLYVPSLRVNAFTLGSRQRPMIGITHGLLEALDRRELAGVLAHEVAHIRHNDVQIMGLADRMTRLTGVLSLFGLVLLIFGIPALLVTGHSIPVLLITMLWLAPTLHRLMLLALSRTREFDADLGAALLTGDPQGLARALQRVEVSSLSWWQTLLWPRARDASENTLLSSHPPTSERVRRLLALSGDDRRTAQVHATGRMALFGAPGVSHRFAHRSWF